MTGVNNQDFSFLLVAVNAKYIHSNPAIYSLRGYVPKELQKYVSLAEYTINHSMQQILGDLYLKKPDVIGFSCYIWNWEMIRRLILELPKVLPETKIWLGGPEVSFHSSELLEEYPQLSGIIIGEGEVTFLELLKYYLYEGGLCEEAKNKLSMIEGLCLPSGYTPVRELTDMDKLPFLYENPEQFENRIIYYESGRGCPYRCSYCLSSIDKRVRFRDAEVVKRELQFFLDHKIRQVKFVDRTFNCNHEHAMTIWKYIKEHDNGITNFHFEISGDILREDEIALLNTLRPGLVQLEIGVQSTNPETIRAIDRVMDVERLEQIVAAIHSGHNIHQHLDLIAGLPYEDFNSFQRSFNRVYAMRPQQLQLGFLKVLKGSAMEEKAQEYGIRYMQTPPYEVLCTDWLSYEELLVLKQVEDMVEIYYNSAQFTATIAFLEKRFLDPFSMYLALARFYDERGYFRTAPARSYRYEVLLEFACHYDGENREIYRQLLLYDMYLRENLKSRPDFAPKLTEEIKNRIRSFYMEEEHTGQYLASYRGYDHKQLSKMTHLEYFTYPVWETGDIQPERKDGFVLFDYSDRDPLTYRAKVQVILW